MKNALLLAHLSNTPVVVMQLKAKKVKQSRYRPGVAQRVPGS